jgi:hypothetical protein
MRSMERLTGAIITARTEILIRLPWDIWALLRQLQHWLSARMLFRGRGSAGGQMRP